MNLGSIGTAGIAQVAGKKAGEVVEGIVNNALSGNSGKAKGDAAKGGDKGAKGDFNVGGMLGIGGKKEKGGLGGVGDALSALGGGSKGEGGGDLDLSEGISSFLK